MPRRAHSGNSRCFLIFCHQSNKEGACENRNKINLTNGYKCCDVPIIKPKSPNQTEGKLYVRTSNSDTFFFSPLFFCLSFEISSRPENSWAFSREFLFRDILSKCFRLRSQFLLRHICTQHCIRLLYGPEVFN